MEIQLIFTYLIVFSLSATTIFISFKLYEKYRLKYLFFFMGYIIIHNILGFFSLFETYLYDRLRSVTSDSANSQIELMYVLIIPLIPLMLLMYLNFTAGIINTKLSKRMKTIFLLSWGLLFIFYLLIFGRIFLTPDGSLLNFTGALVYLVEGIVFYLANIYLVFKARKLNDTEQQRTIQLIGCYYLGVLSVYAISFLHIITLNHFSFLLLHFGYNIPPLFFLYYFLKKNQLEVAVPAIPEENLQILFDRYKITKREGEIILMLLKGRRVKDIGKELFISFHTVKNHIHKIYQKLSVRNRIQLYNLLKEYQQKD